MRQGIIVQARINSTRLPQKVLLPFFQGYSILEIILKKIQNEFPDILLIVATTKHKSDGPIVKLCQKLSIKIWRGDEDNVLNRFIEAGEAFHLDKIIRICADNPFLDLSLLRNLLQKHSTEDYCSYQFPDGTPTIKSHVGIFAEATRLSTLKKVANYTKNSLYLEHVTNYIYSHAEVFSIKWLPVPKYITEQKNIRFTVDTKEDFEIQQGLFSKFFDKNLKGIPTKDLVAYVGKQSDLLIKMNQQIKENSK